MRLRKLIASKIPSYELSGEVEADESYFGGIRIGTRTNVVKGKRYDNSYLVVVPMKITGRQRLRKTLLVEITKTGPLD